MPPHLDDTSPESLKRPRVLFIVPGHPMGPDGITDYSFWLAAAAGRAGVECMVYALFPFDDNIEGYSSHFPKDGAARLSIVCAPPGPIRLKERFAEISTLCRNFKPDWISLQFNPVIFREGRFFLPGLRRLARIISKHAPLSLTVHESYRALTKSVTWQDRILNRVRQFEINSGLTALRPAKIFTSNPVNHTDLLKARLNSTIIPVISNIPKYPRSTPHFPPNIAANACVALIFGRINPHWDPSPLIAAIAHESVRTKAPITIVSIGEVGHRMQGWQRLSHAATERQIPTHHIGPLPPQEISAWMYHATYGLSHTSLTMWTKSSACAAMLLHGLPIIFPDDSSHPELPLPPRFAVTKAGKLLWANAKKNRAASSITPDDLWAKMNLFPKDCPLG